MQRNQSIDALRALGALLVFGFHTSHLVHNGFGGGWIGVPLFFAVSGYLIGGRLLELSDRGAPLGSTLASFYWRRAVRIFPIYWLFLLLVSVLALSSGEGQLLRALPYAWTYTSNFFNASSAYTPNAILGPTWSLAVEEQFYLLFPFVVLLLSRRGLLIALIAMIVAGPALRLATGWAIDAWPQHFFAEKAYAVYVLGLTHIDAFAFGAIVNLMPKAWCQRLGSLRCILPAILLSIAISGLATGRVEGAFFQGFLTDKGGHLVWGYTLLNIVSMLLLCRAVAAPERAMGRATALMAHFGQWSYGFYLIHFPVIVVVFAVLPTDSQSVLGWLGIATAFILATGVARLLYETVEKPAQGLRDLFGRRPSEARVSPPACG
jgi:peptidoglycan/LPS O-acetylase OafA/YrhL